MSAKNKKPKTKKDYNTVLLEKLGHDFGIFGEGLEAVRKDVSVLKEDVGILKEDMKQVKADVVLLREDTNQLKSDMSEVKGELSIIRNDLKEKIGRDEFRLLEQRVLRLEKAR